MAIRRMAAVAATLLGCVFATMSTQSSTAAIDDSPVHTQVVGGSDVPDGKYPWMAYLEIQMEKTSWACGGSLLSEDIILTANHCVRPSIVGAPSGALKQVKAYVGHSRYADAKAAGDVRTSNRVILGKGISRGDWAVIKLDTPIKRSSYATLNASTSRDSGPMFVGIGWGQTSDGGSSSETLRTVNLPFVPDSKCSMSSNTEICAGVAGKATCRGDSGGPLLNDGIVTGLVSWGIGCGQVRDEYGHYTKVSKYLPQIQDAVRTLGGKPIQVSTK